MGADADILTKQQEPGLNLFVSTEVIEHVYPLRHLVAGAHPALKPGGRFICTTPITVISNNLTISLTNKLDRHLPLGADGGHIKFWSRATLFKLLTETGYANLQARGTGRLPGLWMTMMVSGYKPL